MIKSDNKSIKYKIFATRNHFQDRQTNYNRSESNKSHFCDFQFKNDARVANLFFIICEVRLGCVLPFLHITCNICCKRFAFIFPFVVTKSLISFKYFTSCLSLILGCSQVGSYNAALLKDSNANSYSSSYFKV
jgi:hypothetical protein